MREGSGLAFRRGGWITLYELMAVCAALALFLPTAGLAVAQICAQRDRQADRLRGIEEAARLFDCLQADAIGASGAELSGGLPFSFGFPGGGRVFDMRGSRSLRELMSILSQLHCLVSSSTGPMHVAAALRVPTVSLFCPLPACSPELWGPRGNRATIVLPPAGSCAVRCPGDPKVCRFEEIAVERVAGAVLQSLEAIATPRPGAERKSPGGSGPEGHE